jgi:hypothetical protein
MSFWPDNHLAAISLTFDDGLHSHLQRALPELDQRGLRATFYLNPSGSTDPNSPDHWRIRLQRWLPASQAGHEIGNHSLTHPCSLNIKADWSPRNLMDRTAEIEIDLQEAQSRLMAVFPAQTHTSFAYPCYETSVGRGLTRLSYVPVVAHLFAAGRARGELEGSLANDPLYSDLHHLSSWGVERQSGAFMIGLVEQALALGRWGILTFHGIQEGHLPVGDVDFIALLDHLVRRRDAVWTAPVADVAGYIRQTHT